MTSMHKRLSNRVALPVGKQWGTVEGGVAACMSWNHDPAPPPPSLVRVRAPAATRTRAPVLAQQNRYTPEPEVRFDVGSMDQMASSRQNGYLQVAPPQDSYTFDDSVPETVREAYRREKAAFLREEEAYRREQDSYRRTPSGRRSIRDRAPSPVMLPRETTGSETPYMEGRVEQVVKGQNTAYPPDYTVNERLSYPHTVAARPPRAPKPRAKSAITRRKVECKRNYQGGPPDLKVTRPNSANTYANRGKTVSFRPGASSTIGYGGYDYHTPRYVYDDDIIDDIDINGYYNATGSSNGTHFRSWRDSNKIATPDLKRYMKPTLQRSSSHDNLWKMNKYRDVQSKVVTHWDDDTYLRTRSTSKQPPESPGKVNVQLDCPEDSDMTVNVTVNASRGNASPVRAYSRSSAPRPSSKSLAWY